MRRSPVESGMLKTVGYSEPEEILQVEFRNGDVWDYLDVPKDVYDGMMDAESAGKYFHANIKNNFTGIRA